MSMAWLCFLVFVTPFEDLAVGSDLGEFNKWEGGRCFGGICVVDTEDLARLDDRVEEL